MSSASPFRVDLLHGMRVLVTGGGSGIGYEIARQMGAHGAQLVLFGRRKPVLEAAVNSLRAHGITATAQSGDVRHYADCQAALQACVQSMGGLDCLVNAAAGNFLSPAEALSPNAFATVHAIDVLGTFNMARACFEQLAQSADRSKAALAAASSSPSSSSSSSVSIHTVISPSIINISATLHLPATFFQTHAASAKAAVDSLTRNLSLEWGERGVRVLGIAPGAIAGTPGQMKLGGAIEGGEKMMIDQIPLHRLGDTKDIAYMAVFMASAACSYVSGQTFIVDGAANNWRPSIGDKAKIQEFARAIEAKSRQEGIAKASGSKPTSKL